MKGIQPRTLGVYAQYLGHHLNVLNVQHGSRACGQGLLLTKLGLDNHHHHHQLQQKQSCRNFHKSSLNGHSKQALESKASIILEGEQQQPGVATESLKVSSTTGEEASTSETSGIKIKELDEATSNSQREDSLNIKIRQATTVEALLELTNHPHKTLSRLGQIVFQLGDVVQKSGNQEAAEKLMKDHRFINVCSILQNASFQNNPQILLQSIHGLKNIGLAPDETVVQYLENELKWTVRRCSVKHLAKAVEILSNFTSSREWAPTAVSMAKLNTNHPLVVSVETLQRRWVEVSTGTDFIAAFRIIGLLNDDTKAKLEDRAVEQVNTFTPLEVTHIMIALASQKRRATPVLRALAFHFSKSTEKLSAKDLIETLYAMNELSFADPVMTAKICNELYPEVASINNSTLVSSLVTSLGQLRYKHKALIQAIDEWIMQHLDNLRPFDCAAWLLTSAVLNIQTENREAFCKKAKQILQPSTVRNPRSWVNIVHSFLILDQADSSMIASILNPEFATQFNEARETSSKLKLLNVNAARKFIKDYSGPALSDDLVNKWSQSVVKCSDLTFSKSVLETLGNFLPPPKYFKGNNALPSGIFVDAVCKLNENLDPVPYDTAASSKKLINVAVLIQPYISFCLGEKEPTGLSCLSVRLLEASGYYVLTVPYTEFHPQEKLLRRVQYLESKMRSLKTLEDVSG